jgi:hypothetical protein
MQSGNRVQSDEEIQVICEQGVCGEYMPFHFPAIDAVCEYFDTPHPADDIRGDPA